MYSTSSTSYSAKLPARCLAAVGGDASRHRFMVGTCSARCANEVQVVDFDEEANALTLVGALRHEGQVACLAPAPHDAALVATSVQETPRKPGVFGLWRPLSRSHSSRFGSFLDR